MSNLNVLVVAEIIEGVPRNATLSAIAFAQQVCKAQGGTYSVLAFGSKLEAATAELARYGAEQLLVVDDPSLAGYVAERITATVCEVTRQGFGLVVGAATLQGRDLLPRVAMRLEAGYAPDVSKVRLEGSKLAYERPMYAGNAYGWLTIETPIQVVSVRPTEFKPAEPTSSTSARTSVALVLDPVAEGVQFEAFEPIKSNRPELTEAKAVISGGRALKDQFFALLDPLADVLGAAIGATRAVCDAGHAPTELQVGQTGKVVAPPLYIAIGVSGAIQHIAGMKGSKTIVAINKDADAPIFQVADYALVGDLFQIVPELTRALKAAKG